jgi:hypothetical protein
MGSRSALRLGLDPPARLHRPGRDDRLPRCILDLDARGDRLPRSLAPVAERAAGEPQVIAGLVDQTARDAEVNQFARPVDPGAPADLELGLRERRRTLVFSRTIYSHAQDTAAGNMPRVTRAAAAV